MSAYGRSWLPMWLAPTRQRPVERSVRFKVERFEDRVVPTTITVTTTASSGAGSLASARRPLSFPTW
jgi:hypothetical protein